MSHFFSYFFLCLLCLSSLGGTREALALSRTNSPTLINASSTLGALDPYAAEIVKRLPMAQAAFANLEKLIKPGGSDKDIKAVMHYLRTSYVLCMPVSEDTTRVIFVPDRPPKRTLSLVVIHKDDSPKIRRAYLGDTIPGHTASFMATEDGYEGIILADTHQVSLKWQGVMLLFAASQAYKHTPGRSSLDSITDQILYAYGNVFYLLGRIGGEQYLSFIEAEAETAKPLVAQAVFPFNPQDPKWKKLDQILGQTNSESERRQRISAVWLHSISVAFSKQSNGSSTTFYRWFGAFNEQLEATRE